MAELHNRRQPTGNDYRMYAPRIGIDLMQECDHAAVPSAVKTSVTCMISKGGDAHDLSIPCPGCDDRVDLRLWRSLNGEWYLRVRDRFAAGHVLLFRRQGNTWISDG